MKQKKILVSFSAGETSAYMAWKIKELYSDKYEILNIFANTGEEDERSLYFAHKCDQEFGLNLVWVEAKVNPEHGKGTTHTIVDFNSASRNGEPFEALIKKYGIPNRVFPQCTRELKLRPIDSYMKSVGWQDCYTAIGIKNDEIDRISKDKKARKLVYPLISWMPTTKPQVNSFWDKMPFRLEIKSYEGNCKTCWKKSFRKLQTIAVENPERFDFTSRMEEKYGDFIPKTQPKRKLPITFYRVNNSTIDILEMAKKPFKLAEDDSVVYQRQIVGSNEPVPIDPLDETGGCTESCEIY